MTEPHDDPPAEEPLPAPGTSPAPVRRATAKQRRLDDDMWWVRSLGGTDAPEVDPLLPTSERLRRELATLPSSLAELGDEDEVRAAVVELNRRIEEWSRHLVVSDTAPQPTGIAPVDVDAAVARWHAARTRGDEPARGRRLPWRRRRDG